MLGGGPRYVAVPALSAGGGVLVRFRNRLIWARSAPVACADSDNGSQWSPWFGAPSFPDPSYATNVAATGALPPGSLSFFVLRVPLLCADRGDAAVAALLEEGDQLAAGEAAQPFTQLFVAAQQPHAHGAMHWVDAGRRPARSIGRRVVRAQHARAARTARADIPRDACAVLCCAVLLVRHSVVLPGDTAVTTLEDARKFLRDEAWYAQRGVPYRCVARGVQRRRLRSPS
jgi:hypothetical protein